MSIGLMEVIVLGTVQLDMVSLKGTGEKNFFAGQR